MTAFFAHFEYVLLAMISDGRSHVRNIAWKIIERASAEEYEYAAEEQAVIRKFVVPELNLECDDYVNMINRCKVVVTEKKSPEHFLIKNILKNVEF